MAVVLPLVDPTDLPRSPQETRFRQVRADPYPDGTRLRLQVSLTPFQQRPDIDIALFDGEGVEIASTTVVEALGPFLSLTMHLPPGAAQGECSARLLLRYPELDAVDERRITFSMTEMDSGRQETDADTG